MLYKRILLKLSGETLLGDNDFGIDHIACTRVALALKQLIDANVEVAVVIGGGNIFRGLDLKEMGLQRTPADQIGMLATVINGVALQTALQSIGCTSVVMSGLECPHIVKSYNWHDAHHYLSEGNVLIFVGGTGHPYFTTDSAAALRASEIDAELLLKATKVDGIYDKDPLKYNDAVLYRAITYSEILAQKLTVMDATSIAMCRSNDLPIIVFNMQSMFEKDGLVAILSEQNQGTLVTEKPARS